MLPVPLLSGFPLYSEKNADLQTDHPTVRAADAMPPLLQRLSERKPESLDYLGVSYGLTPQLLRYVLSLKARLEYGIVSLLTYPI